MVPINSKVQNTSEEQYKIYFKQHTTQHLSSIFILINMHTPNGPVMRREKKLITLEAFDVTPEEKIAIGPSTFSTQLQVLSMQVFPCTANLSDQIDRACLHNTDVIYVTNIHASIEVN